MKKSIESIWKEGFLKNDALVAPKVNDLYNQKSIHLLDRFEKTYKWNLIFLVIFAFVVLIISIPIGMKYMGIPMFFILNILVLISKQHFDSLKNIDKTQSSYQYLKAYDSWLNKKITAIAKVYSLVYPLIFLSMVLGFWFLDVGDDRFLGEIVTTWLVEEFPNVSLVGGVPLFGIIGVILITGLISFFSKKMYLLDLKAVYGNLMGKLAELLSDMEKLRA
ncbi:MAG: hypothetical protein AB8H03_18575 [Saprospiraceae bacterium]